MRSPDCVARRRGLRARRAGPAELLADAAGQAGTPIVYYVFDLLELDGEPLLDLPLTERRELLEGLLDRRNRTVRLSETFEDGEALYEAAKQQELEGVIAKRADSHYAEGRRTREWLKIKTHGEQEFVICGYTRGQGRRAGTLGSLILGVHRGGKLEYVGNVGTGFTDRTIDELLAKLRPLERRTSPFDEVPKLPRVRKGDVVWVEPRLVCEVEFAEWTHDGHLRAPSFQGLREDKPPEEVRKEEPLPDEIRQREARAQALEPRQGLLAGRGDHEGRPARVLPRGRARARPAPRGPAVHDAPLPRRRDRQGVLPEGRAGAHARLDPDARASRSRRATRRRSGAGSARRS